MIRFFTPALLIIAGFVLPCVGGPNSSALLAVDLHHRTERIDSLGVIGGATLTAGIRILGARNLDSYQFVVRFNSAVCSLASVTSDDVENGTVNFLESLGGEILGFVRRFPSHVNISYTLTGTQNALQAPDGDGLLAVLRFKVLAVQPCTLWIDSVRLVDYEMERDTIVRTSPGYLQKATAIDPESRSRQSFPTTREVAPQGVRSYDLQGRTVNSMIFAPGYRLIRSRAIRGRFFRVE